MAYSNEQKAIETRVEDALEALRHGEVNLWSELFADEGVQEFPYAPEGSPKRIEGKAGIADYLKGYPDLLDLHRINGPTWRHDGDTAIAEFEIEGTARPTGKRYSQRYISVIQHRDGLVTRYVDYWNPQVVTEALGQAYK